MGEAQLQALPSQSSIHIRPATSSDAAAIACLGAAVFTATFGWNETAEDMRTYLNESYTVAAIERDLAHPDKRFFVVVANAETSNPSSSSSSLDSSTTPAVELSGTTSASTPSPADSHPQILGFAQLTLNTCEPCVSSYLLSLIELQRLYVSTTHHSHGIGRLLIDFAQAWAVQQGFKAMWLGVWEQNPRAKRFYEKCGWRVVGEHGFDIGGRTDTDLVMVKELVGAE